MMNIDTISLLTVIAAKSEYGTKMRDAGINPKFIGVGPIEASFNLTKILMQKKFDNQLPDIIFSVGTAGSAILEQAELYQIHSVSYRDMNAVAFGFAKGVTPFVDYPAVFKLPYLCDDIKTASIATGASVINKQGISGQTFSDIDADCVDMETYAVIRVAYGFKIPVIALRGISDGKENTNGITSWEEYLSVIDEKIANFYQNLYTQTEKLKNIINANNI